jgi:NADH-quinone oxidoreductase subunit H
MRFALLQMAEYVNMITVASLGTNLFLGGWLAPLPFLPDSPLWFLLKVLAVLFFFIWLRGTLPRFRYDQLMDFGWKVLLPSAALWILATAGALALLGRAAEAS